MPKSLSSKAKVIAKFAGIASLVGAIAWEGFPPANYGKSNVKEPAAVKEYVRSINEVVEQMKKGGLPVEDLCKKYENFKVEPGWEVRPSDRIALTIKTRNSTPSNETVEFFKKHPKIAREIYAPSRDPNFTDLWMIDGFLKKYPNVVSENTMTKMTELNNRFDTQIKPLIQKHQKMVERRHLAKRILFGGLVGTTAAASVAIADAKRRRKQNLSVRRQRK